MRFLLLSAALITLFACQRDEEAEPTGAAKLEITLSDAAVDIERDWRYAKYEFNLDNYDPIPVAVRVSVNGNESEKFEIKDLTDGREDRAVERADLTGTTADNTHSFSGTTKLEEGDKDFGGKYSGELTLTDDGAEVPDNGCCGAMTFVPTVDKSLTFSGTRVSDFDEENWTWGDDTAAAAQPATTTTTCEDFQLVLNGLKDVKSKERFTFTVALQNCDGEQVTTFTDKVVTLQYKLGGGNWKNSNLTGRELDAAGKHTYNNHFIIMLDNSATTYQFQASVSIDHDDESDTDKKTYTATSVEFKLHPATSIEGSCADDAYSLEVSQQPTDTPSGEKYTMAVSLKCGGTLVTEATTDAAASAPVTKLQFQVGSGAWQPSKYTKGWLASGKKQIATHFTGAVTDLKYKIGVTINGTEYSVETEPFNITD